jgi:hypothetical protein
MNDYGPLTEYMSGKNPDKCSDLVLLVVSAHNAAFSDADELLNTAPWGDYFAASRLFKAMVEHIKTCPHCIKHRMIPR